MKFIDRIRSLTEKSINRDMKLEYKNAIKKVRSTANKGRYDASFFIESYYENEDDIYIYIMDKLKAKGFKVEVNVNKVGKKFIDIFWDRS